MATINRITLKKPVKDGTNIVRHGNAIEFTGEPSTELQAVEKVTVTAPSAPGLKKLSVGPTTIIYTGNRG